MLASETKIPKSTLHDALKRGDIVRRTNSLKPLLTNQNKFDRMRFALSFIRRMPHENKFVFDNMRNVVHVDEKWFYLKRENQRMYLGPEEVMPERSTKSKHFIPKVMFLCAVARPQYDYNRKSYFDGKIGLWPFVHMVPAQRSSRNRSAGTLEMKPLTVNREIYRSFLTEKVYPAIRSKLPVTHKSNVVVQQDNARPHVNVNDREVSAKGREGDWNINLTSQPANSPDFNVLDLGYFNSIQSISQKNEYENLQDLVDAVTQSFDELSKDTLNASFLSLQKVFESSLMVDGGNSYRMPHMGKRKISSTDQFNHVVECDPDLYNKASQKVSGSSSSMV